MPPHDAEGAPPDYTQEANRAWKRRTETRLLHIMPILCAHQVNQTAFAPDSRLRLDYKSNPRQTGNWECGWWALANMATFFRFGEFHDDEPDGTPGDVSGGCPPRYTQQ